MGSVLTFREELISMPSKNVVVVNCIYLFSVIMIDKPTVLSYQC